MPRNSHVCLLHTSGISEVSGMNWAARQPLSQAAIVAAIRGQLEETQWLSNSEKVRRHSIQLAPLLKHFEQTSPWFHDRLRSLRLATEDLGTPETLRRLPVMTKRDIQSAGQRLFCRALPSEHGYSIPVRTSGSTGQPTLVHRTALTELDLMAMILRDHDWHHRNYQMRECGICTHSDNPVLLVDWGSP